MGYRWTREWKKVVQTNIWTFYLHIIASKQRSMDESEWKNARVKHACLYVYHCRHSSYFEGKNTFEHYYGLDRYMAEY